MRWARSGGVAREQAFDGLYLWLALPPRRGRQGWIGGLLRRLTRGTPAWRLRLGNAFGPLVEG